jgi:PAS domain S-box-containing protein
MDREPAEPVRAAASNGGDEAESLFRQVFEHAPEAVTVAEDGRLRLVNRAAEQLTGFDREQMLDRRFAEFVHPEDLPELSSRYERRLTGDTLERKFIFRILDADGGHHSVEAYSLPTRWQGRPAVLSFFTEVTERERQRRTTEELENLLARISAVTPYFLFIYDYDLARDVYINRPVPAALGYSDDEAAALGAYPFFKLCHPDDAKKALERDLRWRDAEDGAIDTVEFRLRARNGDWRWFRSLNSPFQRDEDGRVRQILGVSLDITDQKRSEEALRRSEKLESIGLLAGGLAHDFGNLLTPILGHADLLERKLPPDSPQRSNLAAICTAAKRARELVEQLLVVSGRGDFQPRPIAIDELIGEAVDVLEPLLPTDVQLRTEIAPGLSPVAGDALQLRQVVLNLVGNAGEALSESGGTIVVRALGVDVDEEQAAVLALRESVDLGPAVLLEVEDDGPGMDATTRSRLLEPFFTTKPSGRGLGLASVVGIIRRHRGGIEVDSNPGRGTIFRILLPLADRQVPAETAETA